MPKKCEMCNGQGKNFEYHLITSLITCEYCNGTGIEDPERLPCDQWNEDEPCTYDPESGCCGNKPCYGDNCNAK